MDREQIGALKALSDATRLRIVGRLADGSVTPEALARDLDLPLRIVVRQLGHLEAVGLARQEATLGGGIRYALRIDTLQGIGRSLDELERGAEEAAPVVDAGGRPLPVEDAKVLRAFVVDGRLASIPAQERKRLVILRYLLDACFAEDRPYPEKEVNQRLALFHPDVASLRRYLVDEGLMTRQAGEYRRAG